MPGPLDGIRILAVSQYGAGPFATLHLADLGAEVIKIEDPSTGGDVSRGVIPFAGDGDSLYFQAFNRNKKSVTLDLRAGSGRKIFRQLAARSDAVFNNLRGDVPEKLGLTFAALRDVNPRLVSCSLSGFGTSGAAKSIPAYDYLLQAMLGHMSLTGEPGGAPQKYGLSIVDWATGLLAACALLAGILQARATGEGCEMDVSMFDTSASLLNYLAAWALNRGYEPSRTADCSHPSLVPSQRFATSDGHIMVMCNKEKFFPLLCGALGAPEMARDPRYTDFSKRLANRDSLVASLSARFAEGTSDHWVSLLEGKVPVAKVHSVGEALRLPLMRERGMIVETDHPGFGPVKMMGCPVKIDGFSPEYRRAPALGEHNREILGGLLGLSDSELAALRSEGAI